RERASDALERAVARDLAETRARDVAVVGGEDEARLRTALREDPARVVRHAAVAPRRAVVAGLRALAVALDQDRDVLAVERPLALARVLDEAVAHLVEERDQPVEVAVVDRGSLAEALDHRRDALGHFRVDLAEVLLQALRRERGRADVE